MINKTGENNKYFPRKKIINKVGLDTGVLIALIDNDMLLLSKPRIFIKRGMCYIYQLVVNEAIGVLINKRGHTKEQAISKTLSYLRENNITIIKEDNIDIEERNEVFNELKKQRNKLKTFPKPEDSDLDIMASYKIEGIDYLFTTNFKHFIELGKYLGIFIEGVYSKEQKQRKDTERMLRGIFWKNKYKFR